MEQIINQSKEEILACRCSNCEHTESTSLQFSFDNFKQFENYLIQKSQNSSQKR